MTPRCFAGAVRTSTGLLCLYLCSLCLVACDSSFAKQDEPARVQNETKRLIETQLTEWLQATRELQRAAPQHTDRGWDSAKDREAIVAMKAAWLDARGAYERIEGALAPVFPESDTATDARYDDFLAALGAEGDRTPFDGEGVTGMHAIERILWSDEIPELVQRFEKGLPGYREAAFPATGKEAVAFRTELVARMIADIEKLQQEFEPLSLDIAFVFRGLIDLAVEQAEKVDLAATGREESRYAQTTMRDLRANYQGCVAAYEIFRPWIRKRAGGEQADARVMAAFTRLEAAYAKVPGDAITAPPATWSSLHPTEQDRQSPFGKLFLAVSEECDAEVKGSLHHSLLQVATLLELPQRVTD